MDCRLILLGRFLAFLLLFVQCGFLTAFLVWYRDDFRFLLSFLLFTPALIYYVFCLATAAKLRNVFRTWGLYILFGLIPFIAVIFALCGDVLDEEKFLSPTCLKVILCITPVAFLLLVNTASDLGEHNEYTTLAWTLSIVTTIDLVDGVEMLDIVLEERENSHGIPKEFEYAMITAACVSFLLTLLQIAQNRLNEGKVSLHRGVAILANALQIIFVNSAFMVMRLILLIEYSKDDNETLFIMKNLIFIFLSASQIYWIHRGR